MMRRSFLIMVITVWSAIAMVPPSVFAGSYDLKEMTPAVEQALKNRQARYPQLQNLKQKGVVGEDSKGFVADLGNDPQAGVLVSLENRDRRIIYQALVDQNRLGPAGMTEVQRVFAEVQRDKASGGEYIQSSAGKWLRKA